MRTSKDTSPADAKRRELSIHIETGHVGPHGMPLVYGSTPDKVGTIKGTVKFSCNYDCRGRDIVIMYEAKAEAHWAALENKKVANHHTEEILGHHIWHFPLQHTKPKGLTVATGDYEKAFEVPLVHPSVHSRALAPSSSPSTPLDSTFAQSTATHNRSATLLPSSSYSPNAKIKYTIRAILQRPFPCITDIEASQEVWVLNSCLPPPAPPRSPSSPTPRSTLAVNDHEQCGSRPNLSALETNSVVHPSPIASAVSTDAGLTTVPSATTEEQEHTSKSLISLSMIKSALAMLPTIDLPRPTQLISISLPSALHSKMTLPPTTSEKRQQEQQPLKQTMSSIEHSNSAGSALPAAHSTSALPADVPNSSTESSPRSSVDTTRSSSPESDDDPANYTGLWEPFQIPYSCSLQSEVVFPGQKLPLKIRFGPQKGHHGGRHDARKERDRGKHGRRDSRHDHEEDDHVPQPETLVPHPRFVVKKGILKVVEHTLLREVSVAPVPFKLRYQNQAVLLNRSAAPQLVQGTTFAQQQQQKLQSGRIYADNGLLAIPEAGKDKDNTQIYQEKTYNWSNSHLYDMLQQEAHSQHPSDKASTNQQNPEQNGNSNSNDFKRFFFKPKRHSLDYSTQQQAQSTHTRKTSASTTVSNPHGLSPSPSGSFNTSRIINTIEAKFKAEIMAVSLTPQLQQRERRYQRRVEMILKGAGINDPGRPLADSDDEEEHDQNQDRDRDEEDEEGVWQTTVWIQLPGPAELNTSTETKHIIRKHTLQLILLCGLVGGEDVKHTMSSESLATPSSANREFRLEMDLYVTGPRVPL